MKEFPRKLIPLNRDKFNDYKFNRDLCKLRQKIVEYMYSGDRGGLDLKSSTNKNTMYDYNLTDERLVSVARQELHSLGWKTSLAYGNTTLFIYVSEDELPSQLSMSEDIEC
jgi:hypothetical protein